MHVSTIRKLCICFLSDSDVSAATVEGSKEPSAEETRSANVLYIHCLHNTYSIHLLSHLGGLVGIAPAW